MRYEPNVQLFWRLNEALWGKGSDSFRNIAEEDAFPTIWALADYNADWSASGDAVIESYDAYADAWHRMLEISQVDILNEVSTPLYDFEDQLYLAMCVYEAFNAAAGESFIFVNNASIWSKENLAKVEAYFHPERQKLEAEFIERLNAS